MYFTLQMELKYLYLYTFILLVPMVKTLVQEKPYPPRLQSCLQKMSENASLPQTAGESISHYCISHFLATTNERFRYNVSSVGLEWVHSLLHKYVNKPRVRRQAFNRRRKEYRMLTDAERTAYHTAIKRLKADTVSDCDILIHMWVFLKPSYLIHFGTPYVSRCSIVVNRHLFITCSNDEILSSIFKATNLNLTKRL